MIYNAIEPAGNGDRAPMAVEVTFDRYVLGLGRVVEKKGFDLLLQAWARLAPEHPRVGLVIVGGGGEVDRLRELAASLGVSESVRLIGPVAQAQVGWLMAHAEVFVLPSRVEPFGIVVLEALRAGLPVVVSSRGGATEIVTAGREGLVVDPCDTEALAQAIGRLLGDKALQAEMGARGRERATAFEWSRISAQYRSVYRSVLSA